MRHSRSRIRPKFLLVCLLLGSLIASALAETPADDEKEKNPCDELLAVSATDGSQEEAETTLNRSVARLDDCLIYLMFAVEGDGDGDGDSSQVLQEGDSELGERDDQSSGLEDASGELPTDLENLDEYLSSVEVELDPMGSNKRPQNLGNEAEDSRLQNANGTTAQETEQPSEEPRDEQGQTLDGEDPTEDARHSDKNRMPADPKDEDAVLKQLREAAEKETDPATKQAIWDQYYDYMDSKEQD